MNANALVRWTTVAAVLAIASVAAWVSYEHALAVVWAYGETGAVGYAYPATIDGMIYVSSMAMLDSARRGLRTPALARWMLGVGIAATLAVNVLAGLHSGGMGSVIAAWPALALVGSYELLMAMIRREAVPSAEEAAGTVAAATPTTPVSVPETVADAVLPAAPLDTSVTVPSVSRDGPGGTPMPVPGDVPDTAPATSLRPVPRRTPRRTSAARSKAPEKLFAAEIERGELPSLREIKRRAGCGTPRAQAILAELASTVRERAEAA